MSIFTKLTPAEKALAARRMAAREAIILADHLRPENLQHRREHVAWMRRCAATPDTGPRFAIGAEMDGRHFTPGEIEHAEKVLADLEAQAAELDRVAA